MSNWIPISERLPTREDASEREDVIWKFADVMARIERERGE